MADFTVLPFFSASNFYNITQEKLISNQGTRRSNLTRKISDLKRQGYISSFVRGKETFFEITPKGQAKLTKIKVDKVSINNPDKWDGKWRMIIFDIPEKHRFSRDTFRHTLQRLQFSQIQKSVYVHPFECAEQIRFISGVLSIDNYVKIAISEIIQGEEDIISEFIDKKILTINDLKKS